MSFMKHMCCKFLTNNAGNNVVDIKNIVCITSLVLQVSTTGLLDWGADLSLL